MTLSRRCGHVVIIITRHCDCEVRYVANLYAVYEAARASLAEGGSLLWVVRCDEIVVCHAGHAAVALP